MFSNNRGVHICVDVFIDSYQYESYNFVIPSWLSSCILFMCLY